MVHLSTAQFVLSEDSGTHVFEVMVVLSPIAVNTNAYYYTHELSY
jgi:hypothetical protein